MSHGSSVNDIPLSCWKLCNDQNSNDQNRHTECIHKGRTVNCDYYHTAMGIKSDVYQYRELSISSTTKELLLEGHSYVDGNFFRVPDSIRLIYYTDLNGRCSAKSFYIQPKLHDESQDFKKEIIEGGTITMDMVIGKASHSNKELVVTNGLSTLKDFELFKFLLYNRKLRSKLDNNPVEFSDDDLFSDYQFNSTKLSDLSQNGLYKLSDICSLLKKTHPSEQIIIHLNLCRIVNAPKQDLYKYLKFIPMNIEQINQNLPKLEQILNDIDLNQNISNIISKIRDNKSFSYDDYVNLLKYILSSKNN